MKRLLLAFCLMFSCWLGFAQPNEVSLVVSGGGSTKEEATNNALRSAIEQAFGVFVSANTAILNDELVRDEIATVTSGNIKSYRELNYLEVPGGEKTVTLQAVVSIGNLIAYSKSHGSSAEFAGAIFGANLKLRDLNKQNEEKVLEDFLSTIRPELLFDAKLTLGEPILTEVRDMTEYSIDYGEGSSRNNIFIPKRVRFHSEDSKRVYSLPITIKYKPTAYAEDVFKGLKRVLSTLSIVEEEQKRYDYEGESYYKFSLGNISYSNKFRPDTYYFRSQGSVRLIKEWLNDIIVTAIFHVWDINMYAGNDKVRYVMWSPLYDVRSFRLSRSSYSDGGGASFSVSVFHGMPLRYESWLNTFNERKRNNDAIQLAKDLLTKYLGGVPDSDGKWEIPLPPSIYRCDISNRAWPFFEFRGMSGFLLLPPYSEGAEVLPRCIIPYTSDSVDSDVEFRLRQRCFPIEWNEDDTVCLTDVFSYGYTLNFYFPIDKERLETITKIEIKNRMTEN